MRFWRTVPIVALIVVLWAAGLAAQPLAGTYTCAAGNPGGAFDYGDIGDFMLDFNLRGINAPTTLEVFDVGGSFVSTMHYRLDRTSAPQPTVANRLTIRAAAGNHPVIEGAGFGSAARWGAISLNQVGYVTIDGLTFSNDGPGGGKSPAGAIFANAGAGSVDAHGWHFQHCVFRGYDSTGIDIHGNLNTNPAGILIENNLFWNNPNTAINLIMHGIECIIRHNTILYLNAPAVRPCIVCTGGPSSFNPIPLEEFHSNVIQMTSTAGPNVPTILSIGPVPVFADFNVYSFGGTAAFGGASSIHVSPAIHLEGFAQWQAAGFDINGVVADPLLMSTATGAEDLRLRHNSPARDRSLIASVTTDIFGNPRPAGPARDSGAHEFRPPDIELEFNAAPVVGSVHVGNVPLNGAARVFRINNLGTGVLIMDGPVDVAPGTNCGPGTALRTPPPRDTAPAAFSDFEVFLEPLAVGALSCTVTAYSNDPVKSPYVFTINANVTPPNQAAVASAAAGSTLTGPAGGPFVLNIDPGAMLNNASIELTDPEGDPITISAIIPPASVAAGLTAPAIPAPGQPLTLTWGGVATASAPAQAYTWRVNFADAINGTPMHCFVSIVINNLPPVHVLAGAISGNGSAAMPYVASFAQGQDSSASMNLCAVSDPNTGQTVTLGAITPVSAPSAATFAFALNGGVLAVSPGGLLIHADTGLFEYEVELTDGVNVAVAHVAINVTGQPITFTNGANLPGGTVGVSYAIQLQVVNAIGAVVYTLTSGALPAGLTLDTATGEITGVPLQVEAAVFTIQAVDSTTALGTETFTLPITTPPAPPPSGTGSSSGGGCVAGSGAGALWLLALLAHPLRRGRREVPFAARTGP